MAIRSPASAVAATVIQRPCNDLVLVILTSRFEATRGLFREGSRNFDLRSDDKDDTSAVINSPNLGTTPAARYSAITHYCSVQ
ncbi:hypothetical protein AVEN_15913-1 [Araneus ventricosus]|uniref:Uncharacterized protein n=1 Tax=Araneus ventricosus TaxID=182803 RepID=A0A4Y2QVP0_ARAVE|nr:hypothetical protein AVEN_73012-1 [Araneus ventricosus]GBN67474.1 hypothetical protein AVEN_15913-1 [Araneus ventricosus]